MELNFSFGLDCHPQSYASSFVTLPSVPTPDGPIYGTQYSGAANNAFVRMALDGAITIVHSFTPQEGLPGATPILASDGNFYGLTGNSQGGLTVSVYRVTPAGDLAIIATFPIGTGGTNPAPGFRPAMASCTAYPTRAAATAPGLSSSCPWTARISRLFTTIRTLSPECQPPCWRAPMATCTASRRVGRNFALAVRCSASACKANMNSSNRSIRRSPGVAAPAI